MEEEMGVRVLEGSASSRYVLDSYFPAIAIIGEEQDVVTFVGLYRGDYDLVELQVDPYTRAVKQVTLTGCRHYSMVDEPMVVPRSHDGIVAVDMPPQSECERLRVAHYLDGVSVQVLDEPPAVHVRCGSVVFGITLGGELSEILLTAMTSEEADHVRSVLMGEGLEGDFEPIEG